MTTLTRECCECREQVPLNRFTARDRQSPDPVACIACAAAPVVRDDKLKVSLAARRRKYGINKRDHLALYEIQNHACAVCLTKMDLADLYIDHDHDTDLVRGLLCSPCNTALGFLRDDPARIRRAADYLEWTSVMRVMDDQLRRGELTWAH